MKRKSFGKLAIVAILATLMLFGLCVCSKKADTSATTTTTPAASTTTTTTTTTVATPATTTTTTTVVEEKPAVEEVKVEEPVVETPVVVEPAVEEPVAETVVVEPVVEEPVVVVPEYSTVFSYNGITATIDAYSDHAFISIPEGVTAGDIAAVAKLLVSAYPESSDVTYEIKDGNLCLYYPEQAVAYIKAAVSTLSSDAKWLIDILATEEEPVEEAVAEETTEAVEAPLFSTSFDSDGIKSSIVVYSDHAYLTIPAGVTEQDIVDAAALVEAYPGMQTTAHMQSKTACSALLILHSQQKNLLLTAMSLLLRQLLISTLSSKKLLKLSKSRLLLLHSISWKTALSLQHTNMMVLRLLS